MAVTAQRLRHTFASQMLASGMPVTSLQRYLGHEDLDTTMLYAQVADPLLKRDYYEGVSAVDPASAHLSMPTTAESVRTKMQRLIAELQTPDLVPERKQEITEQMQLLLDLMECPPGNFEGVRRKSQSRSVAQSKFCDARRNWLNRC